MSWQDAPLAKDAAPPQPAWASAPEIDANDVAGFPKSAKGLIQSFKAGFEGSTAGLALRGSMPDLILNPDNSSFWENLSSGVGGIVGDLPAMFAGSAIGATGGAVMGGAVGSAVPVLGTAAGTAAGGVMGAGFGMMAVPAAIRSSLIEAYKSGQIHTPSDYITAVQRVLKQTMLEGSIGAVSFGAGGVAARVTGKAIVPAIGTKIAVNTAMKAIGTSELAANISTMTTLGAVAEGHMPSAEDFANNAVLIAAMHGVNVVTVKTVSVVRSKLMDNYAKTGQRPEQVLKDAADDPQVATDLLKPEVKQPVPEMAATEVTDFVKSRIKELDAVEQKTADQEAEYAFLKENTNKPDALAKAYGVKVTEPAAQPAPKAGEGPPPPLEGRETQAAAADQFRQPDNFEDKRLQNPEIRDTIQYLVKDSGWAEVGGRIIRDPNTGEVTGRTPWVPRTDWWMGRPDKKMNEVSMIRAVQKAIDGENLNASERRSVSFMMDVAQERIKEWDDFAQEVNDRYPSLEGFNYDKPLPEDLQIAGLENTTENRVDASLVQRAVLLDVAAVERAATMHENDDVAFMNAVKEILYEHNQNPEIDANGPADAAAPTKRQPELVFNPAGKFSLVGPKSGEPGSITNIIADQLVATGKFNESEARDQGLLWQSYFETMAQRTGINAHDLFNKYIAGITTEPASSEFISQKDALYIPALRAALTTGRLSYAVLKRWYPQITAQRADSIISQMVEDGYIKKKEGIAKGGFEDLMGQYEITDKLRNMSKEDLLFQSGINQTETPEFKKWFGDSKVVDAEGKPLVVYHGTQNAFESFNPKLAHDKEGKSLNLGLGKGVLWFSSSAGEAGKYAERTNRGKAYSEGAPSLMPMYVKAEKPFLMEYGNSEYARFQRARDGWKDTKTDIYWGDTKSRSARMDKFTKQLRAEGYDAIGWLDNGVIKEIGVFDPIQIKSAIGNRGTFDPNNPNILYQSVPKGYTQLGEKMKVGLLDSSDPSTFLHESGHVFLNITNDLASHPDAPIQLKNDMSTLFDWLGVKDSATWNGMTLEQQRPYHEKFARGFEAWLMEGRAPSPKLASIFDRFKNWLISVYQNATKLNVKLTPAVRDVMSRMIATDKEIQDGIPRRYAGASVDEKSVRMVPTSRQIKPGEKAAEVAQSPFAEIPQAEGEPALPTHINYNYINSSDEVAMALSRITQVYEVEIQKQRRGTVGWDKTIAEAAKILSDNLGGKDPKFFLSRKPGTPAGAAEVLARKQMTIGAAEEMMRARDALLEKGTNASPEDELNFLAAIERAALIQSEFLGARAEAGRALNILKSTARDAKRMRMIQDVISKYNTNPVKMARMLKEIDTPSGALKFAKEAQDATLFEKIYEAWKSGLVSGPITHMANIVGNTTFAAIRPAVDSVGWAVGRMRGAPVEERVLAVEPVARIYGLLEGTKAGMKIALAAMRTEDAGMIGKTEQYRHAIRGKTGETGFMARAQNIAGPIIRLPFRALSAADEMFKAMNEHGEAYAEAARQVVREGYDITTKEFRERIETIVQNPTPEMLQTMKEAGVRYTFNEPLGEKGRAVQNFVSKWHLGWVVPFVRTPINIALETLRISPFAPLITAWKADIKAGGLARDRAIAELAIGTGSFAVVFSMAQAGYISGAGDPDPGKRRTMFASGWQPYSIKIGDKWYNYKRIQPIGTLMGMAADASEMWDRMSIDEADQIPKMLAAAFSNAITSQTFLQGIAMVVNLMSDPVRFAPRFLEQFTSSFIPNIVAQPTGMSDDQMRYIDSTLDAIKYRIPGQRETLYPQLDVWGQPIENRQYWGGIMPVTVTQETKDQVRQEAARLGVKSPSLPKKIQLMPGTGKVGYVQLTPEQRDNYGRISGETAYNIISQMVQSDSWKNVPDVEKVKLYLNAFMTGHQVAAATALPPEVRASAMNEIQAKYIEQMSTISQKEPANQ